MKTDLYDIYIYVYTYIYNGVRVSLVQAISTVESRHLVLNLASNTIVPNHKWRTVHICLLRCEYFITVQNASEDYLHKHCWLSSTRNYTLLWCEYLVTVRNASEDLFIQKHCWVSSARNYNYMMGGLLTCMLLCYIKLKVVSCSIVHAPTLI